MRIILIRNIVVGTAGHIDHGKTALVRALTGIDTDRLEEEKRRGISIDLGFAHLDLPPDLRVGFVDVPGHERFVKNMLAGVGGVDMILFVVAADESIKPQTREHFDICRLLGVPKGVIALTKCDLADVEALDAVKLQVQEFVAGSFLSGAPVVPVSAVTGEGLAELREELSRVAATIPTKNASGHFRLPIDRSFSIRGFGTVVTGTLVSGSIAKDQEVELHPGDRRLRVRGVQVYGHPEERAFAGQRTALNLAGVEPLELCRGMVLAEPGVFRTTQQIDCSFELLSSARPLKHRAPIRFHAGAAEIEAEVRLLDGSAAMEAGRRTFVRILLRLPALLLPGDRFIVRRFSPVVTIGGGIVLDTAGHRYRRAENPAARLKTLAEGTLKDRVALLVRESAYGMGLQDLVARTGLMALELRRVALSERFLFLEQPDPWLLDRDWANAAILRITDAIRTFHRANPLLPGIARQELRVKVAPGAPLFLLDALLARSSAAVSVGEIVRLANHTLTLQVEEEKAIEAIETAFERAGLAVPSTKDVLVSSGVEPARARSLLQILLREKRLLRVGEELVFHRKAIESLRRVLAVRKGQRFTVPMFKQWTGVSRKYAIPLLEYLDRERVTRREGDERVVL